MTLHALAERRELEEDDPQALAEQSAGRVDDHAGGVVGIEEGLGGVAEERRAWCAAGRRERGMRLHEETEIRRHRVRHALERERIERRVETAVDPHRPKQRVARVGREPLPSECAFVVHPVVDDPGPTRERPGGGPEAQGGRQLRRECCEHRIGRLRRDGGPGAATEQIGLRVGPAQASSAVPKACW